jgi:hypothetical protein
MRSLAAGASLWLLAPILSYLMAIIFVFRLHTSSPTLFVALLSVLVINLIVGLAVLFFLLRRSKAV